MTLSPEEIKKTLVVPTEDSSTPIKENEALFIYDFILKNNIKTTLETGFAYAMSGSHIMAATQSPHISIDPFQDHYKRLGVENVKALKLDGLHTLIEDFSHNVLPKLVAENKKFDFIFIDGDHKFDGEFIDFYYADLLVNQKGYILLHDTWMRSTAMLMSFIKTNRKDYTCIDTPLRNFALYQKTGSDERNGMHYREFYTLKSVLTHNLILWMTTGEKTFLKKAIFKLKETVK
jgi:predicted O-methyltransferase YrrM